MMEIIARLNLTANDMNRTDVDITLLSLTAKPWL